MGSISICHGSFPKTFFFQISKSTTKQNLVLLSKVNYCMINYCIYVQQTTPWCFPSLWSLFLWFWYGTLYANFVSSFDFCHGLSFICIYYVPSHGVLFTERQHVGAGTFSTGCGVFSKHNTTCVACFVFIESLPAPMWRLLFQTLPIDNQNVKKYCNRGQKKPTEGPARIVHLHCK